MCGPTPLWGISPWPSASWSRSRALSRNARILILDEPTPTLGDREIERVFAGVRGDWPTPGSSVIFVSHRLGEGLDLCSRVIVLRDGRMITSQPAAK